MYPRVACPVKPVGGGRYQVVIVETRRMSTLSDREYLRFFCFSRRSLFFPARTGYEPTCGVSHRPKNKNLGLATASRPTLATASTSTSTTYASLCSTTYRVFTPQTNRVCHNVIRTRTTYVLASNTFVLYCTHVYKSNKSF